MSWYWYQAVLNFITLLCRSNQSGPGALGSPAAVARPLDPKCKLFTFLVTAKLAPKLAAPPLGGRIGLAAASSPHVIVISIVTADVHAASWRDAVNDDADAEQRDDRDVEPVNFRRQNWHFRTRIEGEPELEAQLGAVLKRRLEHDGGRGQQRGNPHCEGQWPFWLLKRSSFFQNL